MGDYLRTTRECTLNNLQPALAGALRAHLEKKSLDIAGIDVLICCETVSTRQKKGLFGGKAEVILCGVLVTPKWLIWAAGKQGETPGVISARLGDIQVQDYENSDLVKLIPDMGLDISGLRTGTVDPGSAFIGLGPEPAAQKLRLVLKQAVANA